MKFIKGLLLFIIAFLFACILIFTFTQEPFKQPVPALIFAYRTPEIPIYIYVAGAFGVGLLIGLCATLYYYIVLQTKIHAKSKELKSLQEQLDDSRRAVVTAEERRFDDSAEPTVSAGMEELLPKEERHSDDPPQGIS